jgi:modulator of FtsH protease
LSGTKISGRGLESLILLFTIVIVSALGLVPGQTARSLGMEVLGLGVLLWVLCLRLDLRMIWQTEKAYKKHYRLNLILSQAAVLPYLASGAVFLARGEVGLYWLIPAFFFSFGKALADAWVLLVEINR